MKFFPLTGTATLLAVALALVACKPIGEEAATQQSAGDPEVASTPGIEGIDGLETAQQQAGYVIGLELGGTLAPVRGEVDRWGAHGGELELREPGRRTHDQQRGLGLKDGVLAASDDEHRATDQDREDACEQRAAHQKSDHVAQADRNLVAFFAHVRVS